MDDDVILSPDFLLTNPDVLGNNLVIDDNFFEQLNDDTLPVCNDSYGIFDNSNVFQNPELYTPTPMKVEDQVYTPPLSSPEQTLSPPNLSPSLNKQSLPAQPAAPIFMYNGNIDFKPDTLLNQPQVISLQNPIVNNQNTLIFHPVQNNTFYDIKTFSHAPTRNVPIAKQKPVSKINIYD